MPDHDIEPVDPIQPVHPTAGRRQTGGRRLLGAWRGTLTRDQLRAAVHGRPFPTEASDSGALGPAEQQGDRRPQGGSANAEGQILDLDA